MCYKTPNNLVMSSHSLHASCTSCTQPNFPWHKINSTYEIAQELGGEWNHENEWGEGWGVFLSLPEEDEFPPWKDFLSQAIQTFSTIKSELRSYFAPRGSTHLIYTLRAEREIPLINSNSYNMENGQRRFEQIVTTFMRKGCLEERDNQTIIRKLHCFSITLDIFIICNYFKAEINSESILIWKTLNSC